MQVTVKLMIMRRFKGKLTWRSLGIHDRINQDNRQWVEDKASTNSMELVHLPKMSQLQPVLLQWTTLATLMSQQSKMGSISHWRTLTTESTRGAQTSYWNSMIVIRRASSNCLSTITKSSCSECRTNMLMTDDHYCWTSTQIWNSIDTMLPSTRSPWWRMRWRLWRISYHLAHNSWMRGILLRGSHSGKINPRSWSWMTERLRLRGLQVLLHSLIRIRFPMHNRTILRQLQETK